MEFFKCGSWEAMENKVIWAILYLQTKETGKGCTIKKLFQEKWPKLRNGKMWRVTHYFNVAIRSIVLIKTAFSQARHPSSSFLRDQIA